MTPNEVKEQLYEDGLIAIVRGDFGLAEVEAIAGALLAGGVRVLEVTLNSAHALEAISTLQGRFGDDLLVGAGTVRTAEDVERAAQAGASFLIAPNLDLEAVGRALERGVLLVPGVFTASEAQAAHKAGCKTLKLFPADALGAPYLKALRAPLDHLDFIPTGGVTPDTLAEFHAAGAVAFGVGSALVRRVDVTEEELAALTGRARTLRRALEEVRA